VSRVDIDGRLRPVSGQSPILFLCLTANEGANHWDLTASSRSPKRQNLMPVSDSLVLRRKLFDLPFFLWNSYECAGNQALSS